MMNGLRSDDDDCVLVDAATLAELIAAVMKLRAQLRFMLQHRSESLADNPQWIEQAEHLLKHTHSFGNVRLAERNGRLS